MENAIIAIDPIAVVNASETSVKTVLTVCRIKHLPICESMQELIQIISNIKTELGI
jgi:hypothetical protein